MARKFISRKYLSGRRVALTNHRKLHGAKSKLNAGEEEILHVLQSQGGSATYDIIEDLSAMDEMAILYNVTRLSRRGMVRFPKEGPGEVGPTNTEVVAAGT